MRVVVVVTVVVTGVVVVSVYTRHVAVTVLPLASKLVRTSSTYVVVTVAVPVTDVVSSDVVSAVPATFGVTVRDCNSSRVLVETVSVTASFEVTLTGSVTVVPSV